MIAIQSIVISVITQAQFWTLTFVNAQRKVKKSEHSKESHYRKLGRKKALHFAVGINLMFPNHSFICVNCVKLLMRTKLISDTSHLSQQIISNGYRQLLLEVSSVFTVFFYSFTFPIAIVLIAWKKI